jgi:hypothetical protein
MAIKFGPSEVFTTTKEKDPKIHTIHIQQCKPTTMKMKLKLPQIY